MGEAEQKRLLAEAAAKKERERQEKEEAAARLLAQKKAAQNERMQRYKEEKREEEAARLLANHCRCDLKCKCKSIKEKTGLLRCCFGSKPKAKWDVTKCKMHVIVMDADGEHIHKLRLFCKDCGLSIKDALPQSDGNPSAAAGSPRKRLISKARTQRL